MGELKDFEVENTKLFLKGQNKILNPIFEHECSKPTTYGVGTTNVSWTRQFKDQGTSNDVCAANYRSTLYF